MRKNHLLREKVFTSVTPSSQPTSQLPVLTGFNKKTLETKGVPSSIYVVQKYGVPLSFMRFAVANLWNIQEANSFKSHLREGVTSEDVVQSFLLRWDTSYALREASKGYISRDGIDYVVMYHGATRRALTQYSKALLSFRVAASGYDVQPTVLIKPYYQTPQDRTGWIEEVAP